MIAHRLSLVALVASTLAACGGEEKKVVAPAPPPVPTSQTTVTSAPEPKRTPVSPTITVTEDIARACSLHFDDVGRAPKFDFDRSELLPADHDVLVKISKCLQDGPLKGRAIELVGRADPRGTVEYNMALGARRAHSVAAYLEQLGLGTSRVNETSRGELDAIGTDEASWQLDRRVDISLAP